MTAFRLPSRRIVTPGQLIADDDPDLEVMKANRLVVDVDEYIRTEAATANPGEARAVSPPKKKKTTRKSTKKK
jgi:hypothetical protein